MVWHSRPEQERHHTGLRSARAAQAVWALRLVQAERYRGIGIFHDLLSVFSHSGSLSKLRRTAGLTVQLPPVIPKAARTHERSSHSLQANDTPGCVGGIYTGRAKQFIIPHKSRFRKGFLPPHTRDSGHKSTANQLLPGQSRGRSRCCAISCRSSGAFSV